MLKQTAMNLLIGDISSYKAIVIARFIKEHYPNIRIVSFDKRRFTKYVRTKNTEKHYFFNLRSQTHIDLIKQLIQQESIDSYIPMNSTEIELVLSSGVDCLNIDHYLGSYDSFQTLNQKDRLQSLAKSLNIKTPQTYDGLENATTDCVIKPIKSSSSKGVKYIHSRRDLEKVRKKYKNRSDIIIQEYVRGIGVGFSVFAKNGKIFCGYGHKRLAEFPVSGGSSVYREKYENPQMEKIAAEILNATNWTGFAMFEFKLTPRNELYFLEVNPRIWGSINQGLQDGINYFSELLGSCQASPPSKQKNVKTYLSPLIYLSFLRYLFKLNFEPALTFLSNAAYNKADVSFVGDFGGWLSTVLRKFWRD